MQDLKTYESKTGFELVYDIQQSLSVARDQKEGNGTPTNILAVHFRGPVADECPRVVEGVIDSYQNFLNETYQNVSEKTLTLINSARDLLTNKVETQQQAYQEFKLKNPYMVFGQGGKGSFYAERLGKIESKRSDLTMKVQEWTDQYARIQKAYKEGGKSAAQQAILALGIKPTIFNDNNDLEKQLISFQIQRESLLETLGANHPKVKELDKTIATIKRIYNKSDDGGKPLRTDASDVESFMAAMKEEIASQTTMIETLNNMFDSQTTVAREMNKYEVEEERLRTIRDQSQELLKAIVKRLQEINLVKDFGGYEARTIAPPGLGRKVSPNPMTVFSLAGVGGLVAGLCLAYLAELSDKSFRTPAEIRRRLGLPVIGHIPYYGPDEKAAKQLAAGEPVVDPMLCAALSVERRGIGGIPIGPNCAVLQYARRRPPGDPGDQSERIGREIDLGC